MENYNIAQLFDIAFGIKSIGYYNVGNTEVKPKNVDFSYKGIETVNSVPQAARLSALGTPIIFPITFKGGNYFVFDDLGEITTRSYADFELPATTLVNFKKAKIQSKTKATAAKGSVKEMYGQDDWRIDIRGFCLNDPSHPTAKTPREQKVKLYEFDKIMDSIHVVGELFDDLDISHLVIDEIQFNQLKGNPSLIPFYMKCSSDEPIELIL